MCRTIYRRIGVKFGAPFSSVEEIKDTERQVVCNRTTRVLSVARILRWLGNAGELRDF
jgi:hypothetical protein